MTALRRAGFQRNPVPSGRTDLGVHARMQVLSFRVVEGVPAEEVAAMVNAHLPPTVGLCLSRPAPPRFHAGWLAQEKEYRYRLALADLPRWRGEAWRVDAAPERVAEALARCVGTRDFQAFHERSSPVKPRTVRAARVQEVEPGILELCLSGDGFGRYMVRYLAGAAVSVASGQRSLEEYVAALEEARPFRGVKAPAAGLVLWEVRYAPELDPFTAAERRAPPGLPGSPPFLGGP